MFAQKHRNEVALVTGASSGIGKIFTKELAQRGYNLLLVARNGEALESFAQELRQHYGIQVEWMGVDLSQKKEVCSLEKKIQDQSNLSFLVNSAGDSLYQRFQEGKVDDQEAILQVHLLAAIRLAHAAIPKMLERKSGVILNVSSICAFFAAPKSAVYSAAKAGLKQFTESLHLDLEGTGIQVQVLCPGITSTKMPEKLGFDLSHKGIKQWIMSPEDVVRISFRDLKKGKVICIPGCKNQSLTRIPQIIPRSLFYKLSSLGGKLWDWNSF